MKVAILSPYPTAEFQDQLGCTRPSELNNATWTVTLAKHLAQIRDTEVHVVTEADEIPRSLVVRAHGVTIHFVSAPGKFKTLTLWQFDRRRLNRILDEIQPDIVHGQGVETQYGYVAVTSKYPCLITIHGLAKLSNRVTGIGLFSRPKLVEFFESYCLRKARNLVVINPFIAEFLQGTGRRYRLFPISNAVSESFFVNEAQARESNLLLAIGYVDRLKAHDLLLQAMAQLRQRGVACKAMIVGPQSDNTQMNRLQQLIRDEKLDVEFTGFLAPQEVAPLLRRCTVLVHPSRHESSPMAVSEAMATGAPVVASRVGGIPYLVNDGATGMLFEPENVTELADKLELLLKDPARRQRLSARARQFAEENFHPQQVAEKTRAAYETVLNCKPTERLATV